MRRDAESLRCSEYFLNMVTDSMLNSSIECVNIRKYYSILIKAIIKRENCEKLVFALRSSSDDSLCFKLLLRTNDRSFFSSRAIHSVKSSVIESKIRKTYVANDRKKDRRDGNWTFAIRWFTSASYRSVCFLCGVNLASIESARYDVARTE